MPALCLLAQYVYNRPFLQPAPVWDYYAWLLVPLCLGIAIVYKSVRCGSMRRVPREAGILFVVILVVMAASSAALGLIIRWLDH
jgi:hypothetical protein